MSSSELLIQAQTEWKSLVTAIEQRLKEQHKSFSTYRVIVDFLLESTRIFFSVYRQERPSYTIDDAYDEIKKQCPFFVNLADTCLDYLLKQRELLTQAIDELNEIYYQTVEIVRQSNNPKDIEQQNFFKFVIEHYSKNVGVNSLPIQTLPSINDQCCFSYHHNNLKHVLKEYHMLHPDLASFLEKWNHYLPPEIQRVLMDTTLISVKLKVNRPGYKTLSISLPKYETVFLSLIQASVRLTVKSQESSVNVEPTTAVNSNSIDIAGLRFKTLTEKCPTKEGVSKEVTDWRNIEPTDYDFEFSELLENHNISQVDIDNVSLNAEGGTNVPSKYEINYLEGDIGNGNGINNPPINWTSIDLDLFRINILFSNDEDDRKSQWTHVGLFLRQFFGIGSDTDFHLSSSFGNIQESIFATRGPCAHSPPFADGQETLLIRSPVEIAILRNEVQPLKHALDTLGYCTVESETQSHIIYSKNGNRNKPPFTVVVQSMIDSNLTYISLVKKGMRWSLSDDLTCPFSQLFHHISVLRQEHGVDIHVPMLDLAVMSNETKTTCSDWGYNANLRVDGPHTAGWNRQWRPLWYVKDNLNRGSYQITQLHHQQLVQEEFNPLNDSVNSHYGVAEMKCYCTIAHTVRNYLCNLINPNVDVQKQMLQMSVKKCKNLLAKLNDTLHVSIDRIFNPTKSGIRLRKEVCFRYPYLKNGAEYHPDFINSVSYHGMTQRTLDDYLLSFEYVSNEVLRNIGIVPHLYDGMIPYEQTVKRAKSSIASLMRETTGRNHLKFSEKFETQAKMDYFTAHVAEALVMMGYSGTRLHSTFDKWQQGDNAYDPDGRLLLEEIQGENGNYFDSAGNILPPGYEAVLNHLQLTEQANLERNNVANVALVQKLTRNVQSNMHQLFTSRNQGDKKTSRKKYLLARDYLIQIGLAVPDPIVEENNNIINDIVSTGCPLIQPAVRGVTFQTNTVLDPEVTNAIQEEINERDAQLPFLRHDHLDSFWNFLHERMLQLHLPPDIDNENQINPNQYFPIHANAWTLIGDPANNQDIPFYNRGKRADTIRKLARWLNIKVARDRKSMFMIALEFAHVYRVSETHPYDIPEGWVPTNANQIPNHNFLNV